MTKKYVEVKFTKTSSSSIIGQVESDLSGDELGYRVAIPDDFMKDFFGDEWNEWCVEDVQEVTEDWPLLKDRKSDVFFDRILNEAPLFEIAVDDEELEGKSE